MYFYLGNLLGTVTICFFNPFPYIQTYSDASTADNLWKHCEKRRNCSHWATSRFAIMFSTPFKTHSFIFQAVCCKFVVCEKGLNCIMCFLKVILLISNWLIQVCNLLLFSDLAPKQVRVNCVKWVSHYIYIVLLSPLTESQSSLCHGDLSVMCVCVLVNNQNLRLFKVTVV